MRGGGVANTRDGCGKFRARGAHVAVAVLRSGQKPKTSTKKQTAKAERKIAGWQKNPNVAKKGGGLGKE